ncbi:MAG: DUF4199 domain-containing protein [Balneola sp.]|jgi:hypothetical protein|nr:DUF4199 domain-containing protein [Balneola sp.]MBE78583.1 DUF4199 domain-containing protein [Balneola sp.]|tara:strand:- start:107 stop:667 length:561 start_codon:yes stop_codon:yes gene_type:complete
MKKIVLTFGIFAGIINVGTGILLVNLAGEEMVHANSQWIGYLVMIIALSMIFVGIKQYRDEHLGGVIKFGKAFLTGLYIALIASAIYVGVWELYLQVSGVDFIANYQASMIENMQADGASQAEISAMKDQMEFYAEMYENPFLRILITLSEILPVGLIISLISAALLRKSTFFPSNENIDPEAQAI